MNRQDHPQSPPATREPQTGKVSGDGGNGSARVDEDSVPGLIRKLANELSTLFRQELALAKSEMTHAVSDVKTGVSSVAIGGGVLYAGLLFLLGGIMLLLAYWVVLPVAALIVGAVVAIVGAIMLRSGTKKMQADSLTPHRTVESVRKDSDLAKRKMQ
jgi:hypothetical protein